MQISRASAVYRGWEMAEMLRAFYVVIGDIQKALHRATGTRRDMIGINSGNY